MGFCNASGLALTPKKALKGQQQQFREWLAAHQPQEDAEKERKAQEQLEKGRLRLFAEIRNALSLVTQDYGFPRVWRRLF